MDELISYLEERAGLTLFIMDQERCDVLDSQAKGRGTAQTPAARSKVLRELDCTRQIFVSLHRDHVGAIFAGVFEQADDVVLDIHHLLWICNRTVFWGTVAHPEDEISFEFAPLDYYAAIYPGPRPANLSETCACAADRIWATAGVRRGRRDPDYERLRRLEVTIDEASSAPSLQEPLEDWHERLEAFVRSNQSVPALVELLSHEHERVRWAAAAALEQMGARAEPAISALVDAMVRDGSRKAGDALAAIGRPAIAPLIATLASGDRAVRWEAVLALTEIGETAVRDLREAARDDNERVRASALEALDRIKDKPLFTSHT